MRVLVADATKYNATEGIVEIGRTSSTRIVVATFGFLAALAGVEHGVGEILQGTVAPPGLVIESWPDSPAFEILAGEPAMTVIPNLLVTGIFAVIFALALGIWAVAFAALRYGGLVLILLSVLLLLVGGGFGPPLVGVIIGIGSMRIHASSANPPARPLRVLGRAWPWLLVAGAIGYLGLFPGLILVSQLVVVEDAFVYALSALSFGALILSLVAARAWDRLIQTRSVKRPTIRRVTAGA